MIHTRALFQRPRRAVAENRKKDREDRHVIVEKYKSFVKSKRIFWKQGTDAKSLFSGMNRDKDG